MMRDRVGNALEPEGVLNRSGIAARFDSNWEKGMGSKIGAELGEESGLVLGAQGEKQARRFANEPVARQRPAENRIVLVTKSRHRHELFL